MPELSVVVITKNEEANLPGLLASIGGLDCDLVVVDSGSTDRTVELARASGARVFHRDWTGYAAQRLFAIGQARHRWVLSLDADERPTPELIASIRDEMERPEAERAAGYRIHFRHTVFGRPARFGAMWRDRRIRLFDRQRGGYDDAAVHERVVVSGPVRVLRGRCDHRGYHSAEQARAKLQGYARLKAQERFARGSRFHCWHWLRWPAGFAKRYLVRLGFLDGRVGWRLALLYAGYDLEKATYLRVLERQADAGAPKSAATGPGRDRAGPTPRS